MALTTTLNVGLSAVQTSVKDLGTGRFPIDYAKRLILASGTAANQADQIWSDTRTITASGTDPLAGTSVTYDVVIIGASA